MLKLLLVDDEKDILDLFNEFFNNIDGFISDAYLDPLLALEEFIKNYDDYDLIVSDIRMPKMDGIELAKMIRKMNKNIPIIFITAHDIIDIEPSLLKFLDIEDIIRKPIKIKDLMGKIDLIKQKIILKS